MTTVLTLNLNDLNSQFVSDLKRKYNKSTKIEIRLDEVLSSDVLFSEQNFWEIINSIDWSKESSTGKLSPAIQRLSGMPISNIYLFADKLSEKLYKLATREHAEYYAKNEIDNYISVDGFLYARCAVVAEGIEYYETVLNDASKMPEDIEFEPLLFLADRAFKLKTAKDFNYRPMFNYETHSNKSGWK